MSVRKLLQQFGEEGETPPKSNNGIRTQIPVPRFGQKSPTNHFKATPNSQPTSPFKTSQPTSPFKNSQVQYSQPTSPFKTSQVQNTQQSFPFKTPQVQNTQQSLPFKTSQVQNTQQSLPFKTSQVQNIQPPLPMKSSQVQNIQPPLPMKSSQVQNIQPPLPMKSSQVLHFQPPPAHVAPKASNFNCFNGGKSVPNSNGFNGSKSPASSTYNSTPKFSSTMSLNFSPSPVNVTPPTSPVNGFSPSPDRWRNKYDEVETKRKTLMQQNQRLARENEELQRRSLLAERERETAQRDLRDKESQLNHLRKLSEAVYKEYDQLKNQYELETGSMQKAMLQASEWYKQNRALKRRSTALMQRVMEVAPDRLSADLTDDTDSGVCTDDDFEDLRKSVQDLHKEIARLQAESNAIRLQEFEAQETIVDLTAQLEEERNNKAMLQSELKELRGMKENLGQVSRLVATEVTSLREQYEKEKETAQRMKQEADNAKKERNVLAHQSQLLMFEVAGDDRIMQLVTEVENLQRTLEEERQIHSSQIQALQEKLEEREIDGELELAGERLKLAESELQCALERAQRAETHSNQLASKVSALEKELEKKSRGPPPPPPPPLPPPPPPMPNLGSALPSYRASGDGAETNGTGSAVLEMASLLGIPKKQKSPTPPGGAIDDIINQIKGGRFTLKSTEPKPKLSAVEEKPPVVQEMINVLGTLRRKRMSNGGILDDKLKN